MDWIFVTCEAAVAIAVMIGAYERGISTGRREGYDKGFTAGELGGITEGYERAVKHLKPAHGRDGKFISKEQS